jgi:hypothetical protein
MNDLKSVVDIEAFSLGLSGVFSQSGNIIPLALSFYVLDKIPSTGIPGESNIRVAIKKLMAAGSIGLN